MTEHLGTDSEKSDLYLAEHHGQLDSTRRGTTDKWEDSQADENFAEMLELISSTDKEHRVSFGLSVSRDALVEILEATRVAQEAAPEGSKANVTMGSVINAATQIGLRQIQGPQYHAARQAAHNAELDAVYPPQEIPNTFREDRYPEFERKIAENLISPEECELTSVYLSNATINNLTAIALVMGDYRGESVSLAAVMRTALDMHLDELPKESASGDHAELINRVVEESKANLSKRYGRRRRVNVNLDEPTVKKIDDLDYTGQDGAAVRAAVMLFLHDLSWSPTFDERISKRNR